MLLSIPRSEYVQGPLPLLVSCDDKFCTFRRRRLGGCIHFLCQGAWRLLGLVLDVTSREQPFHSASRFRLETMDCAFHNEVYSEDIDPRRKLYSSMQVCLI